MLLVLGAVLVKPSGHSGRRKRTSGQRGGLWGQGHFR